MISIDFGTKFLKRQLGPSIFNVNQSILEVILGIPPLLTQKHIITLKHYLKATLTDRTTDLYMAFIMEECSSANPEVTSNIKNVFKYLEWKLKIIPDCFNEEDKNVIGERRYDKFDSLSVSACSYSVETMNQYTEFIWQKTIDSRLQQMGERRAPAVSTRSIPLPAETSRQTEVLTLSLFYKQNLLNSFLYLSQRIKCPSPICECLMEDQTAYHILVDCKLVDRVLRAEMDRIICMENNKNVMFEDIIIMDYTSVINCSRNSKFISNCIDIVESGVHKLKKEYIIV